MSLNRHNPLRRLLVLLFLLSLLCGFPLTSDSLARNIYIPHDGSEGDPGDGVLNPNPEVQPDPAPIREPLPLIVSIILLPLPDGGLQPVLVLRTAPPERPFFMEGRWHRAP